MVEPTGERTFLTSPGAEATLAAADLATVTAAPADAIYLSGYGLVHPANRDALTGWLTGLARGDLVIFDPGPAAVHPARRAGRHGVRADWVTCNAREAAELSGQPGPAGALRALAGTRRGPPGPARVCSSALARTAACWHISKRNPSWSVDSRLPHSIPTEPGIRTQACSSPR